MHIAHRHTEEELVVTINRVSINRYVIQSKPFAMDGQYRVYQNISKRFVFFINNFFHHTYEGCSAPVRTRT